jgi:hypothetical protein
LRARPFSALTRPSPPPAHCPPTPA